MAASEGIVVPPTTDAADLAKIVCEACWAHFRSWAAWPGITVHAEHDITWTEAPITHVFFNQVYGARFSRLETRRRISTIVTQAQHRGMPVIWRVGPDSTPDNLGLRLEDGGFTYVDDALAMAVDLAAFEIDEQPPSHIQIETVQDDAGLREWTSIGIEGFDFPTFAEEPVFAMHRAIGRDAARSHEMYLARIDGTAVGMATLVTECGVATLQNLATRKNARRQGVGTALPRHVMREGRKRGLATGVLQASSMGQGVYRRIGFGEVGRVSEYILEPN
jgi:ribosomal protein S18 acetylase RimI-like enzyme